MFRLDLLLPSSRWHKGPNCKYLHATHTRVDYTGRITTRVPWWNKEMAKLRVEVRRLFNRARNLGKEGDWERFRETQRAYKKKQ
jgi:hypothetical protein